MDLAVMSSSPGLLRLLRTVRDVLERDKIDLAGVRRRFERERLVGEPGGRGPPGGRDRVLRLAGLPLADDHEPARQRARAVLDPQLPVGLVAAKRQVMTHP